MIKYLLFGALIIINEKCFSQTHTHHFLAPTEPQIQPPNLRYSVAVQVDYLPSNFKNFESALGKDNVTALNTANGTGGLEAAALYRRLRLGVSIGFVTGGDYDTDSLNIEINENQYGLNVGYLLFENRRCRLTPIGGIKWHRYRLINSEKPRKITLNDYLIDRDLDIRFNQILGLTGLRGEYKIIGLESGYHKFFSVGCYISYAFKLYEKPWIYSHKNRLLSNKKIIFADYNAGVFFSYNF